MIVGVSLTPGIHQAPAQQAVHPFPFFRQEGTFAGAQPAFAVLFTDTDVQIGRTDVHIAHDQHRILFVEFGLQIVLQILIERRFGREFGFMIAAFTLREIAVNHCDVAEGRRDLRHNDAALSLFAIVRETAADGNRRLFGQQRDAIMAFLPVIKDVIAEPGDLFEREHVVVNFGFLQANHVRLVFFDDGGQLVWAGTQAVDIKRDEFHSRCHCAR
ncbi:Uncharacterised protein [Klebsiella pneumoniae]|nr:Uncharacterised protein [Klebsiella pneumoniae]